MTTGRHSGPLRAVRDLIRRRAERGVCYGCGQPLGRRVTVATVRGVRREFHEGCVPTTGVTMRGRMEEK